MGSMLTDRVHVEYVPVTDSGNRPTLYKYGVRSLPALILVDAEGAELHRFPPGIRDADAILAVL
jgi:thioredoxin-related protein